MSQPVTAYWYVVKYSGKDIHDKDKALEYVEEGFDVLVMSNSSPDPAGRRTHGLLQADGTIKEEA